MKIKSTIVLVLLITILLSSCATLGFGTKRIDEKRGYVAAHVSKYNYHFFLKNLETSATTRITLPKSNKLSVKDVPEGKYAIYYIQGKSGYAKADIAIPLYLMTIIEISPNSVTYLGSFNTQPTLNLSIFVSGDLLIEYDFERFKMELIQDFDLPENVDINSLKPLTI